LTSLLIQDLWSLNHLDAEMKRLRALGLGSKKRQAEPLTANEEEMLWEKGCLVIPIHWSFSTQ
jgi:hypothetical protein